MKTLFSLLLVAGLSLSAHADLGGGPTLLTEGHGTLYNLNDREFSLKLFKNQGAYYAEFSEVRGSISMRLHCLKGESFSNPGAVILFTCREQNPTNPNAVTTVYLLKSAEPVVEVSASVGDVDSKGQFNQYGFLGYFKLAGLKNE